MNKLIIPTNTDLMQLTSIHPTIKAYYSMYENNEITHDEYMRLTLLSLGTLCANQHTALTINSLLDKKLPGKFIGFK